MFLTPLFFICLLFVRAFLAIILIAAGSAKITDKTDFAATLVSLGVSVHRKKSIQWLVIAIPCMEILLGLFVMSGFWPFILNAILLGMMVSFSLIVVIGLYKAPHATCRCFGALTNSQFSKRGFVRNLLFTAAALIILLSTNSLPFPQSNEFFLARLLLVVGYLLFAFCALQAARTAVLFKERTSS